MRAIYIAKGSPLLPPDFVSMFDDLASSSLDVFFDPSRGLMNLPGFTLGILSALSFSSQRSFISQKLHHNDYVCNPLSVFLMFNILSCSFFFFFPLPLPPVG